MVRPGHAFLLAVFENRCYRRLLPSQSSLTRICTITAIPAFLEAVAGENWMEVNGLAFLLTKPRDLDSVKDFVKQHSNRLVGFGEIELDDSKVLEQIDRFHDAGFRGLGELSGPEKNYDDPAYTPSLWARRKVRDAYLVPHGHCEPHNA